MHQYEARQAKFDEQIIVLTEEVDALRKEHPGCGVEKMYRTLQPDFLGRDRFVELFMTLGYRVKRQRRAYRTTYSTSIYYPNLITGMMLHRPSQVWQSDITYIPLGDRHYYAVFIIDVFTKKIVGYQLSEHMRATANLAALKMALRHHPPPDIHHSDRGSQYIYKHYVEMLNQQGSCISMGLKGQDNAYAERINLTIKDEYLNRWKIKNYQQLKTKITKAVDNYNNKRIHNHLGGKTPAQFENEIVNLKSHNGLMATIYAEGQIKMDKASSLDPFYAQQGLLAPNCPIRYSELN